MEKGNPDREFAREIQRKTQRIAEIVQSLLTFTKHERQSHNPAQPHDIVASMLFLIQTVMHCDQIHLNTEIPENLPNIKCRLFVVSKQAGRSCIFRSRCFWQGGLP